MIPILLTALLASAPPPVSAQAPRPNILLVTLDTTRADHLSVYGYGQPTTPRLEALAAEGVLFDRAYTPVGLTGPAHASLLTGLSPHRHGAVRNGVPLPKGTPTLTTILKERGYETAAFLSGWTLKARLSGLAGGFDVYDDRMPKRSRVVTSQRDGRLTVDAALEWLKTPRKGPFFLWLHLFDPHNPYRLRKETPIEGEQPKVRAYDSEIRYADDQTGRLLDELERRDLLDDLLVIVASDHGESLGENGEWGHSYSVAQEVLRVPLLLRWPGHLPGGTVVRDPVVLQDVYPTVLSLLGLESPTVQEGRDLAALARGMAPGWPHRRTFFSSYPGARRRTFRFLLPKASKTPMKAGYREGPWRVIWDIRHDELRTESLIWGPGLDAGSLGAGRAGVGAAGAPPPDLERAQAEIDAFLESGARALEEQTAELSEEDQERLRGLGYLP